MTTPYRSTAEFYDRVYHYKDYVADVERIREIFNAHGVEEGAHVVEAACGTGNYLGHLSRFYGVSGFDCSPEMLGVARAKLPGVDLFQADMKDFSVLQPRDAIICLFSSIGYLLSKDDLESAARCFAAAVRPGGCVLIEPWITVEGFDPGRPSVQMYNDENLALARMSVSRMEEDVSVLDFNYMIAFRDHRVEHFQETHRLWMAPYDLLLSVFEEAGFEMHFEPAGLTDERGLLVGRRRDAPRGPLR